MEDESVKIVIYLSPLFLHHQLDIYINMYIYPYICKYSLLYF